jgi:hypothetical protein
MGDEIRVISVEKGRLGLWKVHFSKPVWWGAYQSESMSWYISPREAPDRLAAFMWGQRLIEQHLTRVSK